MSGPCSSSRTTIRRPSAKKFIDKKVPIPKPTDVPAGFDDDLEKRLEQAGANQATKPPKKDKKK